MAFMPTFMAKRNDSMIRGNELILTGEHLARDLGYSRGVIVILGGSGRSFAFTYERRYMGSATYLYAL